MSPDARRRELLIAVVKLSFYREGCDCRKVFGSVEKLREMGVVRVV